MGIFDSKSGFTVIDRLILEKRIEENLGKKIEEKMSVKKKANKETTTKQQLLILHYLGVLDDIKIDENTKKAKLLSVLLNRSMQNIRETLTYIDARKIENSEIKTIENLNAILPLFEELGLNDELQSIKADLGKLKID